jgi:hypothetical protein
MGGRKRKGKRVEKVIPMTEYMALIPLNIFNYMKTNN